MAAIPVTMDGVLYDLYGRTTQRVIFMGSASLTGLGVGGGPIIPDAPPATGGPPGTPTFPIAGYPDFPYPGQPIYRPGYPGGAPPPNLPGGQPPTGGAPGTPTFPIWGPPGIELPPGSGYPPVAGHPLPQPPEGGGGEPPKPIIGWEAKVVWTAESGWAVIVVPKDDTLVPTPSA